MNTNLKIEEAFNTHKESEVENVFVPKIQSTVHAIPSTFNEIAENIREQLKPKQLEIWS